MEKDPIEKLKKTLQNEVREHPTWADLRNRLGLILAFEGDYPGAIQEFREALRINPNYKDTLLNLGFSLMEAHSEIEAEEIFEEVHKRFPQYALGGSLQLGTALLHWKKGKKEEGLIILYEALEKLKMVPPNSQFVIHNALTLTLATFHFLIGQENDAYALLNKIQGFEPFIPKVMERWKSLQSASLADPARVLGEENRTGGADSAGELNTFFFNPGLSQFYRDLADTYTEGGDYDRARGEMENGLLVSGNFAEFYNDMGLLHARQGEKEASIDSYKKAVEIDPNFGKAHASLAFAYGSLGHSDLAIEEFKKALALHPYYADLHYNLGLLYFDQKKYDLAIEKFREALHRNPNYHVSRNSLAFCLFATGKYDLALKEYLMVIEGGVSSADIYIHIGLIHQNRKNLNEALHYFDKACKIEPDYAEAHFHLGEIALEKGDQERGAKALERCLLLTQDPELIQKVEEAMKQMTKSTNQ
ncbi:tetratricopeptide repeat protein [candidate division TA06 bacterium]|nr:tetratricopeptide repeat protein [candidate division TA06 bacterium]